MAWEAAPVVVGILLVFLSVLWKQCVIIVRHSEGAPVPLPALRLPADRVRAVAVVLERFSKFHRILEVRHGRQNS